MSSPSIVAEVAPRASLRSGLAVLRSELGPVLGVSLVLVPVGVAISMCLLGLPILSFALGVLTRALLRGARRVHRTESPTVPESRWAGALALGGLALVLAGMGVGASVGVELLAGLGDSTRLAGGLAAGVAAAVVLGAALGPCAFAPLVVADRGVGPAAALGLSFELAARLGPRRAAALGAAAAACVALPLAGVSALLVDPSGEHATLTTLLLAVPFGLMLGPAPAGALLADAYVEAWARGAAEQAEPAPARLRTLGLLAAPVLALLAAALLVAALTPTRMREMPSDPSVERGWHGVGLVTAPQTEPLPGGRAYVRTTKGSGVAIEAYDGGGAGLVSAGFETDVSAIFVLDGRRHGGAAGTHAVVVTNGDRWAVTVVDADGVRQDDGLGERVLGRLGKLGGLALALGIALLLVLVARLGADLGEARALDVPELRDGHRTRGLAALEGTLRLGEGARVTVDVRAGRGRVGGDAWVEAEGGALRFRLPPSEVAWLGAAPREGELVDGAGVLLLSRFESASTRGMRESASAWPTDGQLALGRRADATRALLLRATRAASWTAVPAILACALAAARVFWAL